MFVTCGGRVLEHAPFITKLLDMAHNNYTSLLHYFSPQAITDFHTDHQHPTTSACVQVSTQLLCKLYTYLEQSAQILANKFSSILQYEQKTEYDCLRTVWQKHHGRNNQQSLEDKFDSLNQTISMLKLRARQSLHQQLQQNQKIWDSEFQSSVEDNLWSHPLFELMNQKINTLGMKCCDLEAKNQDFKLQNILLNKKHQETESKIYIYKEKLKKMEKQMFEMAKKKAEIQKQILQKEHSKAIKKQNERPSPICDGEKQNSATLATRHSEYILLLEQEHSRPSLEPSLMNSANIRDKYRHVQHLSRRTTTLLSPNASLDSIKSVKFERTGGKKLIIKGA